MFRIDNKIIVKQDIDIDDTWSPFFQANSPHVDFHVEYSLQQFFRRMAGAYPDRLVHEIGLNLVAPGAGDVNS